MGGPDTAFNLRSRSSVARWLKREVAEREGLAGGNGVVTALSKVVVGEQVQVTLFQILKLGGESGTSGMRINQEVRGLVAMRDVSGLFVACGPRPLAVGESTDVGPMVFRCVSDVGEEQSDEQHGGGGAR